MGQILSIFYQFFRSLFGLSPVLVIGNSEIPVKADENEESSDQSSSIKRDEYSSHVRLRKNTLNDDIIQPVDGNEEQESNNDDNYTNSGLSPSKTKWNDDADRKQDLDDPPYKKSKSESELNDDNNADSPSQAVAGKSKSSSSVNYEHVPNVNFSNTDLESSIPEALNPDNIKPYYMDEKTTEENDSPVEIEKIEYSENVAEYNSNNSNNYINLEIEFEFKDDADTEVQDMVLCEEVELSKAAAVNVSTESSDTNLDRVDMSLTDNENLKENDDVNEYTSKQDHIVEYKEVLDYEIYRNEESDDVQETYVDDEQDNIAEENDDEEANALKQDHIMDNKGIFEYEARKNEVSDNIQGPYVDGKEESIMAENDDEEDNALKQDKIVDNKEIFEYEIHGNEVIDNIQEPYFDEEVDLLQDEGMDENDCKGYSDNDNLVTVEVGVDDNALSYEEEYDYFDKSSSGQKLEDDTKEHDNKVSSKVVEDVDCYSDLHSSASMTDGSEPSSVNYVEKTVYDTVSDDGIGLKKTPSSTISLKKQKSYLFSWKGHANSVEVTGEWTNWSERIPLHPSNESVDVWEALVEFPEDVTKTEVKFIVDGEWTTSPEMDIRYNDMGTQNNILVF